MSDHWFRPCRYSRLPTTNGEEVAESNKVFQKEHKTLRPYKEFTPWFSIHLFLAIITAVALLSGLVGFGTGLAVGGDGRIKPQARGIVPQGNDTLALYSLHG